MNAPKWVRPVVSTVLALAVGVAGCLVASAFAEPDAPQVIEVAPLETTTAQVIEPVSTGDDPVVLSDDFGDAAGWSPATGEMEVVSEPYEGPTPAELALLAALEAADDPAAVLEPTADPPPAEDFGITVYDDPCGADDADESCPDGVRSVVLPLYSRELQVVAEASPPTYAEAPLARVHCEPAPDEAGVIMIGVATTEPADISLRYRPYSGGHYVIAEAQPTAEAIAAWEAEAAGSAAFAWISTCILLRDIDPAEVYWARADVERLEDTGRDDTANSSVFSFSLDVLGDRAPDHIVDFAGPTLLYVAGFHPDDVETTLLARVDSDGSGSCRGPTEDVLEPYRPQTTVPVDHAWLSESGYSTDYDNRTFAAFYLPEGSDLVVCLLESRPDDPSWADDSAYRSQIWHIQTPDRLVPTVTVEQVGIAAGVSDVTLGASTAEGQFCGAVSSPAASADELEGQVLCDGTSRVARRFGTEGDLVVTAYVTAEGVDYATPFVLRLDDARCLGACEVPEAQNYVIPLGTVTVHRGICSPGLFESTCTPPAREIAAGNVHVRVTWEQGEVNDREDFDVQSIPLLASEPEVVPYPQMDTDQRVAAREYVLGSRYDSTEAEFWLIPDRPVDFRVTLDDWSSVCTLPEGHEAGPTTTEVTGRTSGRFLVQFDNLCPGERYAFVVELTADDGATSVYRWRGGAGYERWSDGYLQVPLYRADLETTVTLSSPDGRPRLIESVELRANGLTVGEFPEFAGRCLTDAEMTATMRRHTPIGADSRWRITVTWATATDASCSAVDHSSWTETPITWSFDGVTLFDADVASLRIRDQAGPLRYSLVVRPHWVP